MASKNRPNYKYLARLRERLESLGHSIRELPEHLLLEGTWTAHREYIESELKLPYCTRCKLPMDPEQMDDTYNGMCKAHGDMFRGVLEERASHVLENRMRRIAGPADRPKLRLADQPLDIDDLKKVKG